MNFRTTKLTLLGAVCLLLTCLSCEPTIAPEVKPSDISKEQREQLGEHIAVSIAIDKDQYPVLPDIPPFDTTVYWYTQSLYNQATSTIRLDRQSPAQDRWDANRKWRVTILDKTEKNAFVIPGGNFYVTTGLLKSLNAEYQLFYIMSFEAALMQHKYLLNRLITEFSTTDLFKIANDSPAPSGTTPSSIAETIDYLEFTPDEVREIDELTAQLICQTSIMDRLGILPLLTDDDNSNLWLLTRPSYGSRADYILRGLEVSEECGSFRTNGNYRKFVLDRL